MVDAKLAQLRMVSKRIKQHSEARDRYTDARNELIRELRETVDSTTGRVCTWDRIAAAATMSRIGAINAYNKLVKQRRDAA